MIRRLQDHCACLSGLQELLEESVSKQDLWRRVERFVCHFDGKELSRGRTAMLAALQGLLSEAMGGNAAVEAMSCR